MKKRITDQKVRKSASFRKAHKRASDYASDPQKLNSLLDRATRKARARRGPLNEVWDSLMSCLRLLRAYASGRYRNIPWASLVSITAAVVYFVMPADLIPDFLLGFGFIDDAVLLSWVINSLRSEIRDFVEWEQSENQGPMEAELTEQAENE